MPNVVIVRNTYPDDAALNNVIHYEKAWGNSRVSSSNLRKSCMAVMHNGPGRHAQSQAECVHNSAGTHAQRPAVSMHFFDGVCRNTTFA